MRSTSVEEFCRLYRDSNKRSSLHQCRGLRGDLHITFEEGTSAAWLYDLIQPHVTQIVVCDPRQNALLKHGNKSDRIDARKLADRLCSNQLKPVYYPSFELTAHVFDTRVADCAAFDTG